MSFGTRDKCVKCDKTVYQDEKVTVDKKVLHQSCFRCAKCKTKLLLGNYTEFNTEYYCKPHFQEAFRLAGNYKFNDKEKEASFHSTTPTDFSSQIENKSWREIEAQKEEERKNRSLETVNGTYATTPTTTESPTSSIWNQGKSAIAQSMVSTEDMMPVEEQLARLKRQLDKKIITKEQYDTKVAEVERKQMKQSSASSSPTSTSPTVASVPITRSSSSAPKPVVEAPNSPNLTPSMRRLMSKTSIEQESTNASPSSDEQQAALAKLNNLREKGIITQQEYEKLLREKKVELGIVDQVPPQVNSTNELTQKVENEKTKLKGLVNRGLITQEEYEKLVLEKNLLDRGVITQEEYNQLTLNNQSASQPEPIALVRRNETIVPDQQSPIQQQQQSQPPVQQNPSEEKLRNLLNKGIINQEEYDRLMNEKQPVVDQQTTVEQLPETGQDVVNEQSSSSSVEQSNIEEHRKNLIIYVNERKTLLEQINVQVEQKRAELDQLLADSELVAKEIREVEAEIEQYST